MKYNVFTDIEAEEFLRAYLYSNVIIRAYSAIDPKEPEKCDPPINKGYNDYRSEQSSYEQYLREVNQYTEKHAKFKSSPRSELSSDGVMTIYRMNDLSPTFPLTLQGPSYMEAVIQYDSGKVETVKQGAELLVSYSNRIASIKIWFNDFPMQPVMIRFDYDTSEADALIKENEENLKRETEKKAIEDDKCRRIDAVGAYAQVGEQLINVYFKPASPKVVKTIVKLYLDHDGTRLMGMFEPNPGCFYVAVINIVPGDYYYEIIQTSSDGGVVADTPLIAVSVPKPSPVNVEQPPRKNNTMQHRIFVH